MFSRGNVWVSWDRLALREAGTRKAAPTRPSFLSHKSTRRSLRRRSLRSRRRSADGFHTLAHSYGKGEAEAWIKAAPREESKVPQAQEEEIQPQMLACLCVLFRTVYMDLSASVTCFKVTLNTDKTFHRTWKTSFTKATRPTYKPKQNKCRKHFFLKDTRLCITYNRSSCFRSWKAPLSMMLTWLSSRCLESEKQPGSRTKMVRGPHKRP